MDVIFTHGAGLDVHKKRMTACRITPDPTGQEAEGLLELQTFGTFTLALLALADWLAAAGVTHVAMESTGEYWKPVGSVTKRLRCCPVPSTYECKTRGEARGHLSATRGSRCAPRAIHSIARCAPMRLRSRAC